MTLSLGFVSHIFVGHIRRFHTLERLKPFGIAQLTLPIFSQSSDVSVVTAADILPRLVTAKHIISIVGLPNDAIGYPLVNVRLLKDWPSTC